MKKCKNLEIYFTIVLPEHLKALHRKGVTD
jgi:hypothetical protein